MKKKIFKLIGSLGMIFIFISFTLPYFYSLSFESQKDKFKPPMTVEYQQSELFENPGLLDYPELLLKAKELNKPILLYFNGYACINARKIEENVLIDNTIFPKLTNDFIFVNVYVDDQKKMPEKDWIVEKSTGKTIKKVGMKNFKFQRDNFKSNICPYFVIMDVNGKKVKDLGYTANVKEFKKFLNITE